MPFRQLGAPALLAALAVALTACGGGGGGGSGGQSPTTPVAPPPPPPPPPPPVFSLVVDAAPEPAVGIVGESPARASLTFLYTVDQTGQEDRAWSVPAVSLCEASESGSEQCSTVTAAPASGTTAENTAVTVALSLRCDRALTWAAPVEIVLGDDDARATVAWEVECQIPPFDGELIGVEIYQGVFTRAWSRETGEWTWRTPPPIPWRTVTYRGCRPDQCFLYAHELALTVPMIEVAGRPTLIVARVEHGHLDSYGGLSLRIEQADGSAAYEAIARAVDRAVVLAPGEAPAEHVDVRPPGIPERRPDSTRYESAFRLEVPGSVPPEDLTGQPFRPGAWRPGATLVLTLDPAGEAVRTSFAIDAEHEVSPYTDGFSSWPDWVRFPPARSPFEPDEPERLVIVPVELAWQGDVWLPAPDLSTASARRLALSDLLAFLPFGDHEVELVSEPLRVEFERDSQSENDLGGFSIFDAVMHYKSVHYDRGDFVLGLFESSPYIPRGGLGAENYSLESRWVWPAEINPVATSNPETPRTTAHEVGHNLSMLHAPACLPDTDPWAEPHWPEGIAYWDDAPGPVRQFWMGDWTDPGDGRFNMPRTSESDTRLEVGADLMGRCRGGEWAISDWYYHKAVLFRAAAAGWLDMPEEPTALRIGGPQSVGGWLSAGAEASLTATGPSVVVTGSVDADGGWSLSFADLSERAPTQSGGSHRLVLFGPDGSQTGEAYFDPATVSHGGGLVRSLRVGYSGEAPVRLTVEAPDGDVVLDLAVSL